MKKALILFVPLLLILSCSAETTSPAATVTPTTTTTPTAGVAAVEQLYQDNCSICHGDNRQGDIGPALTPQRLSSVEKELLEDVIKNGRPDTIMPSWKDVLTEEEIEALVDLIRGG